MTDVATAADIASVELRVGHTASYATSLSAVYNQTCNLLYLYDTSGNLMTPGFAPGSTIPGGGDNLISNSLGSLDCTQTTVTQSGNNLVIVGT